jgi:preprotein translocase subunit SecG
MTRVEILIIRAVIVLALVGAVLVHARGEDLEAAAAQAQEHAGAAPSHAVEAVAAR